MGGKNGGGGEWEARRVTRACCKSPRERGEGPELRYGDAERKTEFKEVQEVG